ncbi:uroporphyrinogen-III synthase [Actinomyces sp. 565]|uniref:uroporphyrinogen-III synthase n=1 Tax=Actinomyces sp. 565 TaxID=2057794 RepID=UPI0013A6FC0C|nr:uroporphyrinogen-III synthase [Actinomyces sp. 565]
MSPAEGTAAAGTTAACLAGRRVLLPRAKPGDAIAAALAAAGAAVMSVGLTRAVPGPVGPRERAAARLADGHYAWGVLTSARTLDFFDFSALGNYEAHDACGHVNGASGCPDTPARVRPTASRPCTGIAVVGTGTARAVRERLGCEPDLVAAGSGTALLELPQLSGGPDALATSSPARRYGTAGGGTGRERRLLLPGSALASPALAEGLRRAGWEVDAVAAYTMEPVPLADLPVGFTADWVGGRFDAVVLVAGSSTRALVDLAGPPPPATRVVTIGKPTAAAAAAAGLRVDAVAARPTPEAIRDALITTLPAPPR